MPLDLLITLSIILIGVILFVRETFSIDTTSIMIMALLIVTGILTPEEGFKGFNHPATLTLGSMFVISTAVFKSGVMNKLSAWLLKLGRKSYFLAVGALMLSGMFFSAFINDTAVVAILMPVTIYLANHMKIGPSKFLIPLSFASLFGGTCTLIGTSTNLLVSGYIQESGLEPFHIFEFSVPAILIASVGFVYMITIGVRLLPNRRTQSDLSVETDNYLVELEIPEGSEDSDVIVRNSKLVSNYDINIIQISRKDAEIYAVNGETLLKQGDKLKVIASPNMLSLLENDDSFYINHSADHEIIDSKGPLNTYEMMVPFGSDLAGKTPKELNFRRKYRAVILGVKHNTNYTVDSISNFKLKEGDLILLRTTEFRMKELLKSKSLYTLSQIRQVETNKRNSILSILILLGVILAPSLGVTNILISGMVGSLLIIALNILTPQEAYNAIEWKVIFMVAGVLSMGTALEKTGGARLIGEFTEQVMGSYNPGYTLAIIYLITFLSTNILSSKATAALMAPIVISVAQAMEISPRPFLVGVMFACSLTFMTPVSYPTSVMIYAPGNYRFSDFLKIGTPLNIITWILASILIPYFFPF